MNYYRAIIWQRAVTTAPTDKKQAIYSPFANQLIVNKESYSFAIKGGHNDEPHNHNDLGSFIFSDKDGQVFCDLGAGRYTKDYFDDSKRYGIFCNSSEGHSVPVVGGEYQSAGKNFSADLTFDGETALCDMTKAYNHKNLSSLQRKAHINEKSVVITDAFITEGKLPVTERFVSKRRAVIKDGELIFGSTILLYPADKVKLSITERKHTPHEYDTDDETVYCYDFILNEDVTDISFEITTK